MSAGFTYRRRPFRLTDPWPQANCDHGVRLHHPLLSSPIKCPAREIAPIQTGRLDELQAKGYRPRRSTDPDTRLWERAERYDEDAQLLVLDHVWYFTLKGEPVLINFTFEEQGYVRRALRHICHAMTKHWQKEFTFEIDPRFNWYWPGIGTAFAISGKGFAPQESDR
jgi:hypothetical protein